MSDREFSEGLIKEEDFGRARKFIITLDGEFIIGPPGTDYLHYTLVPGKDKMRCLGGGFCYFQEEPETEKIICEVYGKSVDFGRPDLDEIKKVSGEYLPGVSWEIRESGKTILDVGGNGFGE